MVDGNGQYDPKTAAEQQVLVAKEILEKIREGVAPWQLPWHHGLREPENALTGRTYTGKNALSLWLAGQRSDFKSHLWATMRQWARLGARLQKGSKGIRLFAPRRMASGDFFDEGTTAVVGFSSFHVFNCDQVNNYNPDHPDLFEQRQPGLDDFVVSTGATIVETQEGASYDPNSDRIFMPPLSSFRASAQATAYEGYYSTLAHELIHWTNRPGRTPRHTVTNDQLNARALEELTAELGAAMICSRFRNNYQPIADHAAYLSIWLSALKDKRAAFFTAFKEAQRAVAWLLDKRAVADHSPKEDSDPRFQVVFHRPQEFRPAKPAASVTAAASTTASLPSVRSLTVVCGHCGDSFSVTVSMHDDRSACPLCFGTNLH